MGGALDVDGIDGATDAWSKSDTLRFGRGCAGDRCHEDADDRSHHRQPQCNMEAHARPAITVPGASVGCRIRQRACGFVSAGVCVASAVIVRTATKCGAAHCLSRAPVAQSELRYRPSSSPCRRNAPRGLVGERDGEPRLLSGGFAGDTPPPETYVLNFLPRVKVPTLMLHGRYDGIRPLETHGRPFFQLLGTPEAPKRLAVMTAATLCQ
jgi:hypothetical protein